MVDGQRKLTILKPLPATSAGKKFELRNKVIGVYDKGKSGTVMETEQSIVDKETGEVYSRTVSSSFFVGQGNWGGPKGELLDMEDLVVWLIDLALLSGRPEYRELRTPARQEPRCHPCSPNYC